MPKNQMAHHPDKKRGHILFLCHSAERKGAPMLLKELAKSLQESGQYELSSIIRRNGEMRAELKKIYTTTLLVDHFPVLGKLKKKLGWKKIPQSTIRQYRENPPDLIYVNTVPSLELLAELQEIHCPVICHVHELSGVIREMGLESLLQEISAKVTHFIAVSNAVAKMLKEDFGIPETKISIYYGRISNERGMSVSTNTQSILRELAIPPDSFVICGCGTIDKRKGTDLFVEVAKKVQKLLPTENMHFVWIGSGLRKPNTGRNKAIHFIGERENPQPYFEASTIFLLTSREDPFPLVMLEAAKAQLPIICFDKTGGASEFVTEDCGIIVPHLDTNAMAEAIIQLRNNEEKRRLLGERGREKVLTNFLCAGFPEIQHIIQTVISNPLAQSTAPRNHAQY